MSGNWTGVMGDVITGRYPMSLNSWVWRLERNPILDFVSVVRDNEILVMTPNRPEFDLFLYIRPFRYVLVSCNIIHLFYNIIDLEIFFFTTYVFQI